MNATATNVLPPLYPHPTIVVLPGGAAHAGGRFFTGAEDRRDPWDAAWDHAHEVATWCGREVRVSVGRANGTVETYALDPHGGGARAITLPVPAPGPVSSPSAPDPGWGEDPADRHDLWQQVRAADRAGAWSAAQAAAARLTAQLEATSAVHPQAVLASELQGYYAARARDWKTAARLCMAAAERRHRLHPRGPEAGHNLNHAVKAWLNFRHDAEGLAMGFELAHLLIRLQPHRPGPIASVLGCVTHLIRAGARP